MSGMRLDIALHELRLFRSRTQAQTAIAEGRLLLNGEPAKPSHLVRPGDRITLVADSRCRTVEVLGLPGHSLSKQAAKLLVREVAEG